MRTDDEHQQSESEKGRICDFVLVSSQELPGLNFKSLNPEPALSTTMTMKKAKSDDNGKTENHEHLPADHSTHITSTTAPSHHFNREY
jgi:hypothetical protein